MCTKAAEAEEKFKEGAIIWELGETFPNIPPLPALVLTWETAGKPPRGRAGSLQAGWEPCITMLYFTLFLSKMLEVPDHRLGCQVVEGLGPQVCVTIRLVFPLSEERADIKGDFPLHRLIAPQALHHRLAEGPGGVRGAPGRAKVPVLGLPVRGGLCFKREGRMLGRVCRPGRGR